MCAPMGSLPLRKGATMRTIWIQNNQWSLENCPVLCIVHFAAPFAQKCDHPPPPTHTFLRWPFLTDFIKYTHTPPNGTKFWRIGPKVHRNKEKCQNPLCWRTTNVPERYADDRTTCVPSSLWTPTEVGRRGTNLKSRVHPCNLLPGMGWHRIGFQSKLTWVTALRPP